MSATVVKPKTNLYLITYDYGTEDRPHTRKVPHDLLVKEPILFAQNIISIKCLDCGVEFHFIDLEQETKIE